MLVKRWKDSCLIYFSQSSSQASAGCMRRRLAYPRVTDARTVGYLARLQYSASCNADCMPEASPSLEQKHCLQTMPGYRPQESLP